MTRPVPNLQASLVDKLGKLLPPWNTWFQQFSQAPNKVAGIAVGASPFFYTANIIGQVLISGGTVSAITLIRGLTNIILFTDTSAPRLVLVSIGDTVKITYSVAPSIAFLEL